MDKNKRNKLKKTMYPSFVVLLFVLFIHMEIIGCVNNVTQIQKNEPNKICGASNETLSPDGKKVIFAKKKSSDGTIILAIHELSTGKLHKLKPTTNDYHTDPVFSPDGKKIAFISGKNNHSENVFIANTDGTDVKQLTFNTDKYPDNGGKYETNKMPTFSPDGKKIIFVRSGIILTRPTEMKANWDVFDVDILTGAERRLTNYRLFIINRPQYIPDGIRFLFSGDNFSKQYKSQYGENQIYLMNHASMELKPAFVYGDRTFAPSVDRDGNIVFLARVNHVDKAKGPYVYDVFIKKKGEIFRLTQKKYSEPVLRPFISYDGSRILFRACTKDGLGSRLWIMNNDGTDLTEVKIDYAALD